jgi:N-methylhydantoinase B
VQNVVVAALSRMVACSKDMAREGPAVTKGHMTVMTLAGLDRDGGPFGTFLLDSTAGGGGAYPDHDGLDGSGDYCVPRPAIANVEANEANGPFLYLYRGFVPDTGGPGRMRGGAGASLAVTPYQTEELHAMMLGHGVEVPNSIGQSGGLPGACGRNFLRRGAGDPEKIASLAASLDEILEIGVEELGPKPGRMALAAGDVLGYAFQGGGGYGDPIKRDSAAVKRDVVNRHVSREAAKSQYGVVFAGSEIDAGATARQRDQIRARRLGRAPKRALGPGDLSVVRGRFVCSCGGDFGAASGNWKDKAHTNVVPAGELGRHVRTHAELELREHVCVDCGALLEVEVARKSEPSLASFSLAV